MTTKALLKSYRGLRMRISDIAAEKDAVPLSNSRGYGEGKGSGYHDLTAKALRLDKLDREAERCRQAMARIEDSIKALPLRERQILWLIYIDGSKRITIAEAARRCGISESYAGRLHSQGLKHISSDKEA